MTTAALMVAGLGSTASAEASTAAPASRPTIVDIASSPGFSTLRAAVVCTGLAPTLSSPGALTVFAPTDAAFGKLGLNAGNVCTALDKTTLTNVLLYHVTRGNRYASSLLPEEDEVTTVSTLLPGQQIQITAGGRILTTSGGSANIVATNIRASNGVVHVIDSVLIPGHRSFNNDEGDNQD